MEPEKGKPCSKSGEIREAILEKALDEFLERHDPERKQARREKRKGPDKTEAERQIKSSTVSGPKRKLRSRHIPAGIRDAVFSRDNGRCTYIGRNGVRCGTIVHLQVDHIRPFSLGGGHSLDNLRLLCGKHNRLAAGDLLDGAKSLDPLWRGRRGG